MNTALMSVWGNNISKFGYNNNSIFTYSGRYQRIYQGASCAIQKTRAGKGKNVRGIVPMSVGEGIKIED